MIREACQGNRIQELGGPEQPCSSRSGPKRNGCSWQDEQEKMFLKYRVRTKGEGEAESRLSRDSEVKPGSLWLRGKVRTQAESRAPSVTHQCFEGLDEGGRKIYRIWSEKSQAATPVSHRDFSVFALPRAVKTISNSLLFSGQNLLLLGNHGRSGLATRQLQRVQLEWAMLPGALRNATSIQAPGSVQAMAGEKEGWDPAEQRG